MAKSKAQMRVESFARKQLSDMRIQLSAGAQDKFARIFPYSSNTFPMDKINQALGMVERRLAWEAKNNDD